MRPHTITIRKPLIYLACVASLVACGGGGSNSAPVTVVTTSARAIVDTAQTQTFNASTLTSAPAAGAAFYGQDAQISGTVPSYTKSADGKTVYDQVTQLTWMSGPNTTLTAPVYSDRKTSAGLSTWVVSVNAMAYGGYSDWRLPNLKELYSLIQFTGTDASTYTGTDSTVLTPFIDRNYFRFAYGYATAENGSSTVDERLIDAQYASSDIFVMDPGPNGKTMRFGVNFADGRIKGYDVIAPTGEAKAFFVQLVRGSVGYASNIFISNTSGTVTDSATGLMWTRDDNANAVTWQEALAWVQTKNAEKYLGYSDWRLPNAKELQSIVNYANAPDYNAKPAIDTTFFNCTAIQNENGQTDYGYYWTSTTHVKYTGVGSSSTSLGEEAVYIAFGRALGYSSRLGQWIDVHGAGAQRSDPKVGAPFAHATTYTVNSTIGYAFGPQLDAIRGKNMLRLVRSAP